jgi:zinc/manganese transport system substrate-binding protein
VLGQEQKDAAQTRMRAVATFSILWDLVRNVGGEHVAVTTLVGRNGDVHVYEPTPGDVKTVALADVVFVNGLGLEGWLDRLVAASGTHARLVIASDGVKPRHGLAARDRAGIDPHAWQSVANAKIYVANIRDALGAADPAGKEDYDANATIYLRKLDALDAEVRAAIERIPVERRKIVTTHSAFGYFSEAYGIEFVAPEGLSMDAEPSARSLAKLIEQIRREKIPAVFIENVADPRLMQRIAAETGAKIGGTLYSDALSPPNGPAATYIDMMRSNVRELLRALTS